MLQSAPLDNGCLSAGYTETISSSGTPVIDTMQDSAAAELGMPGEDESADRPEDDAVAGAPETLEELDAQLDEQEADINATQVRHSIQSTKVKCQKSMSGCGRCG